MTLVEVIGTLTTVSLLALLMWMAWPRSRSIATATASADGVQEQLIVVRGGYAPDEVRVKAGRPVRLMFRRDETAMCSERVVIPDFDCAADLPTGRVVPIEFLPSEPGEHEFTCQMGMLRGRIVVESA